MSRDYLTSLQVDSQDQDRAATQRELGAERTARSAAEFRVAAQFAEIKFLRACLDEIDAELCEAHGGGESASFAELPGLVREVANKAIAAGAELEMVAAGLHVASPREIEDGIRSIKEDRDGLFRSNTDAMVILGAAVGESLREAALRVINELMAARRQATESSIELANAITLLRQRDQRDAGPKNEPTGTADGNAGGVTSTGAGLSPAEGVRS